MTGCLCTNIHMPTGVLFLTASFTFCPSHKASRFQLSDPAPFAKIPSFLSLSSSLFLLALLLHPG